MTGLQLVRLPTIIVLALAVSHVAAIPNFCDCDPSTANTYCLDTDEDYYGDPDVVILAGSPPSGPGSFYGFGPHWACDCTDFCPNDGQWQSENQSCITIDQCEGTVQKSFGSVCTCVKTNPRCGSGSVDGSIKDGNDIRIP